MVACRLPFQAVAITRGCTITPRTAASLSAGWTPDGRDVETLDGQKFLAVNGVQTLSQSTTSMAYQIEALREVGVTSLRMSPQSAGFAEICAAYADHIAGKLTAADLAATLIPKVPGWRLSDGFVRGAAGAHWSGTATEGNRHGL